MMNRELADAVSREKYNPAKRIPEDLQQAASDEPSGASRLFDFGAPVDGAPRNYVRTYESGHIETWDVQSAEEVQQILDKASEYRERNNNPAFRGEKQGVIGAIVPITLWQDWRRQWERVYRHYYTWSAFEARQLNSREFERFRCIDEIPVFRHQT